MSADMTKIVPPKWWAKTKRGWGMVVAGLTAAVPIVAPWVAHLFGVEVTLEHVSEANKAVLAWLEASGYLVGFALWAYGSFFPTAPIAVKVTPPKEQPVV